LGHERMGARSQPGLLALAAVVSLLLTSLVTLGASVAPAGSTPVPGSGLISPSGEPLALPRPDSVDLTPDRVTSSASPGGPGPAANSQYWTNISTLGALAPGLTVGGAIAFDPTINRTVLMTEDAPWLGVQGHTFEYVNFTWSIVAGGPSQPPSIPDAYAGLAYDPVGQDLVAFGGQVQFGTEIGTLIPTNATYEFAGGMWSNVSANLSVAPPPSGNPLMATDPAGGNLVLLEPVGATNASLTWTFANGVWTNVTATAGVPPPGPGGADSVLAYDPALGAVVFFGGSIPGPGYANATNATWEFHGGQWSRLDTPGPPMTTGTVQTMAYDDPEGDLVDLIGPTAYYAANGTPSYEQWDLASGGWSNFTANSTGTPPLGFDPLSVWDPADNYLLYLSGGYDAQSWALGQVALSANLTVYPSAIDVGDSTTITVAATGGVPPISYAYSGLPPGCSAFPLASFVCTPTTSGNFTVYADVEAGNNVTLNLSTILAVGPTLEVVGPLVADANVYQGSAVNFSVSVSGGLPPYQFSWSVAASNCTPPNAPQFTCAVDALGPTTVGVAVTDSSLHGLGTVSTPFDVVLPPGVASLASSADPVEVGSSVYLNTTLNGGALPLNYTYLGLPGGCAPLDRASLNCTPTTAGTFSLHVTVRDALGSVRSANLSLTVVAGLVISIERITPNPAPLGSLVTFNYSLSGGEAPFHSTWFDLPTGCTSNESSFTCTMGTAGDFDVGLSVRDGLGRVATANVTLVVDGPGATPHTAVNGGPLADWEWGVVVVAGAAVVLLGLWRWSAARRDPVSGTDDEDEESELTTPPLGPP
jgi:hypothetical protein